MEDSYLRMQRRSVRYVLNSYKRLLSFRLHSARQARCPLQRRLSELELCSVPARACIMQVNLSAARRSELPVSSNFINPLGPSRPLGAGLHTKESP